MKNKFMRIAAVMLMLCLVTTCAISGTFAKYTTEGSGDDQARVAYWGWNKDNVKIELDDLFKTSYDKNVLGKDDVIAPGTTNFATFQFIYDKYSDTVASPEVAYTFKIDLTDCKIADDLKANGNIKWAVVAGTTAPEANSNEWGDWDAMITELNALDGTETFEAGAELPAIATSAYTIAWMWNFSTNADGDAADTALANKDVLDTVKIAIKITATQLD